MKLKLQETDQEIEEVYLTILMTGRALNPKNHWFDKINLVIPQRFNGKDKIKR